MKKGGRLVVIRQVGLLFLRPLFKNPNDENPPWMKSMAERQDGFFDG